MNKSISFVLKLATSAALLSYLFFFSGIVNIPDVVKTLKETRLPIFIFVSLIGFCNVLITAKRWSLLLPEKMKYSRLVSFYLIGYFFGTFLPGRIGGDIVKTYYLYRDTGKGGISIASVFIDRYMGLCAIIGISFIALIGGFPYFKDSGIVWVIPAVFSIFMTGSLIFWKMNWGKIKGVQTLYTHISEYKKNKRILCIGLILSLIVQILCIIEVYLLSTAIGLTVPVVYFFIFVPIINAVSTIPVTIAGLGIREVGFATLFNMFFMKLGVTANQAVSLSLLTFATMMVVNVIGGIEYVRIGRLSEKENLWNE